MVSLAAEYAKANTGRVMAGDSVPGLEKEGPPDGYRRPRRCTLPTKVPSSVRLRTILYLNLSTCARVLQPNGQLDEHIP